MAVPCTGLAGGAKRSSKRMPPPNNFNRSSPLNDLLKVEGSLCKFCNPNELLQVAGSGQVPFQFVSRKVCLQLTAVWNVLKISFSTEFKGMHSPNSP